MRKKGSGFFLYVEPKVPPKPESNYQSPFIALLLWSNLPRLLLIIISFTFRLPFSEGERRQPPYGPRALCWRACGRHQLLLRRGRARVRSKIPCHKKGKLRIYWRSHFMVTLGRYGLEVLLIKICALLLVGCLS